MAFISVTRLRLRSLRFLPGFAVHAVRAFNQARRADGFTGGSVLADRRLTFWTLTAWDDIERMRAFMTADAHGAAMPYLLDWCDQASVAHWTVEGVGLPTWTEAERRMRAQGRPSRVRHPSPGHQDLSFAPARTSLATAIAPVRRD